MDRSLEEFLATSGTASRVRMKGRVVVRRFSLPASELLEVKESGRLEWEEAEFCELEYGGVVIAAGQVVERDGEWFFVPSAGAVRFSEELSFDEPGDEAGVPDPDERS